LGITLQDIVEVCKVRIKQKWRFYLQIIYQFVGSEHLREFGMSLRAQHKQSDRQI
jgi:hypothetical protein